MKQPPVAAVADIGNAELSAMDDLQPGERFGNYTLEVRLGGGGFGSVWRAKDNTSGETVALKILVGKFSSGDVGRIRSEVELLAAAASSDSPHVVRVLGGGTEPSPHVVMEFIEGHDLEHELDQRTKLPQDETLRIVRAVAEALAVLEKAGIIHRDVKPANVMLAKDGTIKLTDFGIAKIAGYESVTATGQLPLSAAYAAPEVWGGEATYQSDFYALGAVAFQCLTGSRPFAGTFVQLYEYHKTRPPDWALLPGDTVSSLRQLMVSCLAKEPAERPATSAALLLLIGEADAELAQRTPDNGKTVAGHEPRALGPWLIESKHESQPWAFRCLHETSGERATVEVHFSDSLELGEQINRAVMANPTLVPLGAERLLGTNRLILRPGESWPDRSAGQFMFWVARQELPHPTVARSVGNDLLAKGAANAVRLNAAAADAGVSLAWTAEKALLLESGEILLVRPSLPDLSGAAGPGTIEDWFSLLPLTTGALGLLGSNTLRQLAAEVTNLSANAPKFGVARLADTADRSGTTEAISEIATWSRIHEAATDGSAHESASAHAPTGHPPFADVGIAAARPILAPTPTIGPSARSNPPPVAIESPPKRLRLAKHEAQGLAVVAFVLIAAMAMLWAQNAGGGELGLSAVRPTAGSVTSLSTATATAVFVESREVFGAEYVVINSDPNPPTNDDCLAVRSSPAVADGNIITRVCSGSVLFLTRLESTDGRFIWRHVGEVGGKPVEGYVVEKRADGTGLISLRCVRDC